MGSATREALISARKALDGLGNGKGLVTGKQLFQAARVIGDSSQLRGALADPSVDATDKSAVINSVFAAISPDARGLLAQLVESRWSTQDDMLAGIEEIGIRAVARSVPQGTSVEGELFAFGSAVSSNAELELAVGSKLGSDNAKAALVSALLESKASEQTTAIVSHLVQQPRGRRINELVRYAASTVADEAGLTIATVTTAAPITAEQLDRLATGLSKTYGRDVKINQVMDPSIIGGVRVQVGDDVIDGSISTRLTDLRLQLAR